MDHPLHDLIEAQLAKAKKDGAFEDLPGEGKPLTHLGGPGDATKVRLQSESGVKPTVTQLNEAIAASRIRLAGLTDPSDRKAEMKILADLQTRLAIEIETFRRFD